MPIDRGHHRHPECLESVEDRAVVVEKLPYGLRGQVGLLAEICTGTERPLPSPREHQAPDGVVGFHIGEGRKNVRPHLGGDDVEARVVQGKYGDVPSSQKLRGRGHPSTPSARSAAISCAPTPSSWRTSSVCWPRSGAAETTFAGVSDNFTTGPSARSVPNLGCSTSTTMSRAMACGSPRASGTVLIGPAGMPTSSRTSSQYPRVSPLVHSSIRSTSSGKFARRPALVAKLGASARSGMPRALQKRGQC